MSRGRRWIWFAALFALILVLIAALSWIAGGPEEVHEILQPIAVPELAQ